MEDKFKHSNAEVKSIKAIQFGVISPEFIKNISVTQYMEFGGKEISKGINVDVCDDPATGQANLGAINDPRMGNNSYEHPGYFGHIELVTPVYHIGFLKIVLDILRCVSYYTSELLVPRENYINKKGRRNLKEIAHIAKTIKKCPITQKKLPSYSKEGTKIAMDFGQGKEIISTNEVYSILEKISDEDARILGLNPKEARPEWLILKTLPVPPPHVRPSVFMSSSQKCDDDLTTKLIEIVKANMGLAAAIEKSNQDQSGTNDHHISQLEALLQYNVSTFIDNQHPGQVPSLQRSGKPLKTLRERLSGKDGRVRGNLMGKRVDFSARTVITADPNLSIDQVGVPKSIAMNLTIPEKVTDFNKERLLEIVKRGPNAHPGAKFVIKTGGTKLDLKFANITELKNGWVVERHLSDGDAVLFNRQPSLHKMSIMGHRTKVLEGSTFRLNLACTSPYNADFDGDEMNLHVPQCLTARAEVEKLMSVDRLIVSPQANKPVIGIIQDSLLSSCKMTRRNILITKDHLMNVIMLIDAWDHNIPKPAIIKNGVEYWTGKQVYSLIIPHSLSIGNLWDLMNYRDQGIFIKNGQILSGSIDKSVIGKSQGGLIHILFNDYGPGTAKVFLNQVQKLSNYWIKQYGFTIGVGDAIPNIETTNKVQSILKTMNDKIKVVIDEGIDGNKDPRLIEEFINAELNSAVGEAGKKAEESLSFNNNFKAAVSSGSKGSNINISQIMASVGQQNVEGKRIGYGFKHRTLPHFPKNDISPESRGFVENSYISGLSPTEFWFHAQAGREGLIDTACKSISGDTDIVVIINNIPKCVKIGQFIDEYIDKNIDRVERRPYAQNTEVVDFREDVFMPTIDKNGLSSWSLVTHVTRHDPGELVYLVKTRSGREVKVVESKSLIIFDKKTRTFEKKLTSQIEYGDCVPVTEVLSKYNGFKTLSVKTNFSRHDVYLDNEFGMFIGVFLKFGEHKAGSSEIIFSNPCDMEIITNWLKKTDVFYSEIIVDSKLIIKCNSRNLSEFLYNSTHRNDSERYIPDYAFNAPDDFVLGLLYGYCGGSILTPNFTKITSTSGKIINGLSFLLSKFGIFGTISKEGCPGSKISDNIYTYSYIIEGKYIKIMQDLVYKIPEKDQLKTSTISEEYTRLNDVILDPIISIERLDPRNYPKVYDVTIPDTDIFQLLNGISVWNTAETGYIQRRLVKALEDVSIRYDYTVRNSRGLIIQFLYGEDGLDATYMENVHIVFLKYNAQQLREIYYNEKVPEEFELIKQLHSDFLEIARIRELNNAKYDDDYYPMPANLTRTLVSARKIPVNKTNDGYLTDREIFEEVKNLDIRIARIFDKEAIIGSEKMRSYNASRIFRIYIWSELATNKIKNLTKRQIQYLIEEIEFKFTKTIAEPGEMCGVLAAQSIGEPATQLSSVGTTQVIVMTPKNKIFKGTIADLIDPLCSQKSSKMISEVVNISGYKILGVDPYTEKTSWCKISQISRHPANGNLIRIKTMSGKSTTATASHSFLKRTSTMIVPIRGSDLKIGDRIPVVKFTPSVTNPLYKFSVNVTNISGTTQTNDFIHFTLNKDFGWFIGSYLADGFIINSETIWTLKNIADIQKKLVDFVNSFEISLHYLAIFLETYFGKTNLELKNKKSVGHFVFQSNLDFIAGIISGFFDSEGICGFGASRYNYSSVDKMVYSEYVFESATFSEQIASDIIILLSYFGIFALKTLKNNYIVVQIPNNYAKDFAQKIGLRSSVKKALLDKIISSEYDKFSRRKPSYEYDKIPELKPVFDSILNKLGILNCDTEFNEIERSDLINYIINIQQSPRASEINYEIKKLKEAALSDVVWDQITSIELLADPKEYVYDFTVPGNQSFLVDCNILVHNTLNTFHHAGLSAKNVTLGVPRIKELINVTKKLKTPSLTLYEDGTIKSLNIQGQKRIIESIRSKLEYKTLQDIVISSDIVWSDDQEYSEDIPIIDIYREIYDLYEDPIEDKFLSLRLQFSTKGLEYIDTSLLIIAKLLEKEIGNKIICSDDNTENNSKENLFIRIIPNESEDALHTLRKIEILCMSIKIKGSEGIERVYTKEAKVNNYTSEKGHHKESNWVLETEGSNLLGSMEIDGIDHSRSVSNNVIEMYEVFGIEAARQTLLNELRIVLSFDGSYVNYRHLSILVDTMTCRGNLMAMTRHGINRIADVGALVKCTFEETCEVLLDAAAFGELDTLKGISDNIMLGQLVPTGTGIMELIYDESVEADIKLPAISREPTPFIEILDDYVPSEPNYDPLAVWVD